MFRDDRPNRFFMLVSAEHDDEFIDSGSQKAGANVFNKGSSPVVEQRFGRPHRRDSPAARIIPEIISRNHIQKSYRAFVESQSD